MQYQLNLYPDDSFFVRTTVTGRQTTGTTDDIGSWVLSSDRTVLVLKGQGDSLDMFTIGPNGSLKKVDANTKPLPGHLPNDLAHAAAFKPLSADLPTLRGSYSMADRAAFVECSTGQRWLVADEGAAAEMEAAYLKARTAPGASVLAEIEGVASPGTGRDGGSGASVVVRKLKRLLPRESCEPRYTGASLTNTYWRLTSLADKTVAAPTDPRREQSLTFQPGDMPGERLVLRLERLQPPRRHLHDHRRRDHADGRRHAGRVQRPGAGRERVSQRAQGHTPLPDLRQVLELFDDAGTRVARFAAQMPAGATKR
jgi:uncharacterized lipoprotein NlpE involved in copper resistance